MKIFIKLLALTLTIVSVVKLLRIISDVKHCNELTKAWSVPNKLTPHEFLTRERKDLLSRPDDISGFPKHIKWYDVV